MKKSILAFGMISMLILAATLWMPPSRTPAPEGFDESDFPALSSLASSAPESVLDLDRYGLPNAQAFLPELSVTAITLLTDAEQKRTLFIDPSGNPFSPIPEDGTSFRTGPFVVAPYAVYEVTAAGISPPRPPRDIGRVSGADLDKMITESTRYLYFDPNDLKLDDPDRLAGRTVHILQHNGEWKRVASVGPPTQAWKIDTANDLQQVFDIRRAARSGTRPNFFGSRFRVELTHFDQVEFLSARGAPMGSTTGRGREAQWIGTGFYTVFADGKPVLRFSIEEDREYLIDGGSTDLNVWGNKTLDFILATYPQDDERLKMAIIRGS